MCIVRVTAFCVRVSQLFVVRVAYYKFLLVVLSEESLARKHSLFSGLTTDIMELLKLGIALVRGPHGSVLIPDRETVDLDVQTEAMRERLNEASQHVKR